MNVSTIQAALREATEAAYEAADNMHKTVYGGVDQGPCGFAWVELHGIKGNTKLGRAMKEAGISKSYNGTYQIWNPSQYPVQNVDVLLEGAIAAADVFKKYGFTAYSGSRLD